mmetsp:Transcript_11126/g.19611  ORF Transcript_11126/g.19611 Transcript_11126/m.19611 type:complete len:167 (+) Transcript_11126:243-743(+)
MQKLSAKTAAMKTGNITTSSRGRRQSLMNSGRRRSRTSHRPRKQNCSTSQGYDCHRIHPLSIDLKDTDSHIALCLYSAPQPSFPCIEWSEETEDHDSSTNGSSSSSLEDYMASTGLGEKPARNADWWVGDASHRLQVLSLEQQHMHRSMAFFDLDSLLIRPREQTR